jgi:hypothetical protein
MRAAVLAVALAAAGPALAQTAPPSAAAASADAPLDPKAIALAHEILDIGMPPETRPTMFAGIMESIRTQMRDSMAKMAGTGDAETDAIIGRGIDRMYSAMTAKMNSRLPEIYDAMARAYARQFSMDDLAQIRVFVSTPAGQRFFSRSANIVGDPDFIEVNKRSMAEIMAMAPELQKQMMDELMAHLAKRESRQKNTQTHPG